MTIKHECGSCTLCCKIQAIPQIKKPAGKWCPDCTPGKGCGIYDKKPAVCKNFVCMWLASPDMPDKFKPNKINFYVSGNLESEVLTVCVDPAYPLAWRQGDGKDLVDLLHKEGRHLLIVVGNGRTLIPGKDTPLPEKIQEAMNKHIANFATS